jgi:hypothetical protein
MPPRIALHAAELVEHIDVHDRAPSAAELHDQVA